MVFCCTASMVLCVLKESPSHVEEMFQNKGCD